VRRVLLGLMIILIAVGVMNVAVMAGLAAIGKRAASL
jgi:predicted metal-binding membrane protein